MNDLNDCILELGDGRKEQKLSWSAIASIINKTFDAEYNSNSIRKKYNRLKQNKNISLIQESEQDDSQSYLQDLLFDLKKEKINLSDERTALNARYRYIARENSIFDIAEHCAEEVSKIKFLDDINLKSVYSDKIAILQISDWHYGAESNLFWNQYNPEICIRRINRLKSETIEFCKQNCVNQLYLVNLSDLISGNIHQQLRIESRYNVIQQVINVSEILAEFIHSIANEGIRVKYFDCLDNHSRWDPNKKESIQLESFTEIIHWYLQTRFKESTGIEICENKFSRDIITFDIFNWKFAGVHGDLDKMKDVVSHISLLTHDKYDVILTAHNHHFEANEQNECLVISNPSLMGTDTFAQKLRASSKPAQNILLVTKENELELIKRIVLD